MMKHFIKFFKILFYVDDNFENVYKTSISLDSLIKIRNVKKVAVKSTCPTLDLRVYTELQVYSQLNGSNEARLEKLRGRCDWGQRTRRQLEIKLYVRFLCFMYQTSRKTLLLSTVMCFSKLLF